MNSAHGKFDGNYSALQNNPKRKMKLTIDKNNLLTIDNESIPKTKEYTYHVSGYSFSDFDK